MRKGKGRKGSRGMRERGYTAVVLWLSPDELKRLDKAKGTYSPRSFWCKLALLDALRYKEKKQKTA